MRQVAAVKHGERHCNGNAVVTAEGGVCCHDEITVDAKLERVFHKVDRVFGRFFRDHVEVALQNDGGGVFVALCSVFPDDDIVQLILLAAQPASLGKADAVVADGLGVAGAMRDLAQILEEVEYGVGLQMIQYAHNNVTSCDICLKAFRSGKALQSA